MIELDQYKLTLNQYKEPLADLKKALELDRKQNLAAELEKQMESPDFWQDPENDQKVSKEVNSLKESIKSFHKLETSMDDIDVMIEMAQEEEDEDMIPEIGGMLDQFVEDYENMRIQTLLSGDYDKDNAIVTLHAGAG